MKLIFQELASRRTRLIGPGWYQVEGLHDDLLTSLIRQQPASQSSPACKPAGQSRSRREHAAVTCGREQLISDLTATRVNWPNSQLVLCYTSINPNRLCMSS